MSEKENRLPHGLELPEGKKSEDMISERHDMVLLFEAKKANPNGDPDAENMPRVQPNTLKGLVTDVCMKRKIRNFFSLYNPDGNLKDKVSVSGYEIFIRENAILEQLM
ncbi:MAG: type I CRISPR-associated protein Cas7, partial [Bacteroidota bacterium]